MNEKDKELIFNERYNIVRKSNELVNANTMMLSSQQQKILLYLISQIKPYDEKFKFYEFSIQDYCKVAGIDYQSGYNYASIKESIKQLRDKSMWIKLNKDGDETLICWIEKPIINQQKGIIKIKFDEDLKPYRLQLKSNFTSFELINVLGLNSKYSIALYQLILSRQYNKLSEYQFTMPIEELKKKLGIITEMNGSHFNNDVIKPALKEINQKTDKNVSSALCDKSGRAYKSISFTISSKNLDERIDVTAEILSSLNKYLETDEKN